MSAPETGSRLDLDDDNWQEWVNRHGRKAAIGAGVVALVAIGVWTWRTSAQRKEQFASQELMRARSSAEQGNMPLAASDLQRVTERFGGTNAADQAVILLNQIRLLQGQRDVAVNALQDFVRGRHPDHVKASAYALLAGGLEDQGKNREAADAYRRASEHAGVDTFKAQYLLDAGRALAGAGDTTAARSVIGEVITRYPEVGQVAEARVRLAELGGEVPEADRKRS